MGKAWYGNRKVTTLLITGASVFFVRHLIALLWYQRKGEQY